MKLKVKHKNALNISLSTQFHRNLMFLVSKAVTYPRNPFWEVTKTKLAKIIRLDNLCSVGVSVKWRRILFTTNGVINRSIGSSFKLP